MGIRVYLDGTVVIGLTIPRGTVDWLINAIEQGWTGWGIESLSSIAMQALLPELRPGQLVRIHGLRSAVGRDHNGKIAQVALDQLETRAGRIAVQVIGVGGTLHIKRSNLRGEHDVKQEDQVEPDDWALVPEELRSAMEQKQADQKLERFKHDQGPPAEGIVPDKFALDFAETIGCNFDPTDEEARFSSFGCYCQSDAWVTTCRAKLQYHERKKMVDKGVDVPKLVTLATLTKKINALLGLNSGANLLQLSTVDAYTGKTFLLSTTASRQHRFERCRKHIPRDLFGDCVGVDTGRHVQPLGDMTITDETKSIFELASKRLSLGSGTPQWFVCASASYG